MSEPKTPKWLALCGICAACLSLREYWTIPFATMRADEWFWSTLHVALLIFWARRLTDGK